MAKRTVYCGKVSEDLLGEVITVKGWVQKRRDLGALQVYHVPDVNLSICN
ncbi:hypothetical protein AB6846_10175 [Serratia proteamaculans]